MDLRDLYVSLQHIAEIIDITAQRTVTMSPLRGQCLGLDCGRLYSALPSSFRSSSLPDQNLPRRDTAHYSYREPLLLYHISYF
jgi:hypothetical protein